MSKKIKRTLSLSASAQTVAKNTPVVKASVAPIQPTKPSPTAPSQAMIAKRAYEIWLARGREPGRDREHWLEAERQLQQG